MAERPLRTLNRAIPKRHGKDGAPVHAQGNGAVSGGIGPKDGTGGDGPAVGDSDLPKFRIFPGTDKQDRVKYRYPSVIPGGARQPCIKNFGPVQS